MGFRLRLTLRDQRRIWRVLVGTGICQLLFGLVGLLINYHYFWFLNVWFIGALGTIPGVILGTVWHFSGEDDRRDTIGLVCYGGFLAVALTVCALVFILPMMRRDVRSLARLTQLRKETIGRIEVMDQYGKKCLRTVTDAESLAAFAEACSDAVGYETGHPKYTHSWDLVVVGAERYEFDLHFDPEFPDRVVGYFNMKPGDDLRTHCTFQSRQLRPWVEEHLLPHTRSRARSRKRSRKRSR